MRIRYNRRHLWMDRWKPIILLFIPIIMKNLKATFNEISEDLISKIQESGLVLDLKEEKESKKFRVIASTEDIDRSWEIIKANGWKRENFMKNPVIIANHVYKIENIVGKATKIYVKDNQLVIEWIFSSSNPLGKLLGDLYEEWMVKSVSVWFIPKKRDENNAKIITEAELLELSFVAVPCNPNALSLDQKQLLEDFWLIKNEEVWISSSLENWCGEGVNDSTNESIIEKSNDISNKEILSVLGDIKQLLERLVDGNTKKLDDAHIIAKESLQWAARAINAGLEKYKKALRG